MSQQNNGPKFPTLAFAFVLGVILLFVLGIVLLSVSNAEASGNSRSDGCNTFNVFAHQNNVENGLDFSPCQVGQRVSSAPTAESQAETPDIVVVIVTETEQKPPVEIIVTPKPLLPTENPPTKIVETPEPQPTKECKNPNQWKDGTEDCNAGIGNN